VRESVLRKQKCSLLSGHANIHSSSAKSFSSFQRHHIERKKSHRNMSGGIAMYLIFTTSAEKKETSLRVGVFNTACAAVFNIKRYTKCGYARPRAQEMSTNQDLL